MNELLIAPSILAADFGRINEEVRFLNDSEADWLHIDVMDGVFVPNISFGFPVLKSIQAIARKPMDVHLMIVNPSQYLEQFRAVGADTITVHYEACTHLHRTIQEIKLTGAKACVALNPHTSVDLLFPILEDLDMVCLMSVNPGFGGQKFISNTLNKIEKLRLEIDRRGLNCRIEIDGGVGLSNAQSIVDAGADVLVAGSSVFRSDDPGKAIKLLKSTTKN